MMVIKVWAVACFLIGVLSSCLAILCLLILPFTVAYPEWDMPDVDTVMTRLILTAGFSALSLVVGWRLWRSEDD